MATSKSGFYFLYFPFGSGLSRGGTFTASFEFDVAARWGERYSQSRDDMLDALDDGDDWSPFPAYHKPAGRKVPAVIQHLAGGDANIQQVQPSDVIYVVTALDCDRGYVASNMAHGQPGYETLTGAQLAERLKADGIPDEVSRFKLLLVRESPFVVPFGAELYAGLRCHFKNPRLRVYRSAATFDRGTGLKRRRDADRQGRLSASAVDFPERVAADHRR